jgi:dTDP-glucose 4,6-dehydratase
LHVKDHCIAIDKVVRDGKIGETYCIGGDAEKTNMEITNIILETMDKDVDMIEHIEDRKGHDKRYAIDFTKIKNELGWEPSVTFEEGIANTINWYRENEDWWRNIKSGEYQEYYNKQYGNK